MHSMNPITSEPKTHSRMSREKSCSGLCTLLCWWLIGITLSCDSTGTDPSILPMRDFSFPISGELEYAAESSIQISNDHGGIMITGVILDQRDSGGGIPYYLDRIILATQRNLAEIAKDSMFVLSLPDLTFINNRFISVVAPLSSEFFQYSGLLSLEIPSDVECCISEPAAGVLVSEMEGLVTVTTTNFDIQLERHHGNCALETQGGGVFAEFYLLPSRTCVINTVSGDIHITLPDTSSVSINASTIDGGITVSNYNLTYSQISSQEIIGVYGTASSFINVNTTSGNIQITGLPVGN